MAGKNGAGINSLIGEGSIFEGSFYINGSLQIDGRFEGDVRTEDELVVGATGKVKTDIFARRVIVGGTVIGNIQAEETVTLLSTGRVLGNISAPKVDVEEGVVVHGEISISAGQQKDIKNIIEESFNAGPKIGEMLKGGGGIAGEKKVRTQDA